MRKYASVYRVWPPRSSRGARSRIVTAAPPSSAAAAAAMPPIPQPTTITPDLPSDIIASLCARHDLKISLQAGEPHFAAQFFPSWVHTETRAGLLERLLHA